MSSQFASLFAHLPLWGIPQKKIQICKGRQAAFSLHHVICRGTILAMNVDPEATTDVYIRSNMMARLLPGRGRCTNGHADLACQLRCQLS